MSAPTGRIQKRDRSIVRASGRRAGTRDADVRKQIAVQYQKTLPTESAAWK